MMKSDSGREILKLVLKNLVPKFSNNNLKNDRYQIKSKLKMHTNISFKKLYAKAWDSRHALQILREDIGPHKLLLNFFENI